MASWNRITCAIDFSATSRRTLFTAAELARTLDAKLTVVHVGAAPVPVAAAGFAPEVAAGAHGEPVRLLEAACEEAAAVAPFHVEGALLDGEPASEVLKQAAASGCDLLVVGTHGRTGLERLAAGSVAGRILRDAPCSVLAVRDPPEPALAA